MCAAYRLPQGFEFSIQSQQNAPIAVLREVQSGENRALGPASSAWCWPSTDQKHSWLFQQPTAGQACDPAVRAFDPLLLKEQWALRPGVGEFRVSQAFERAGVLLLNIEASGSETGSRSTQVLAVNVSDGRLLWSSPRAGDADCHVEHDAASQTVLALCSYWHPPSRMASGLWSAYELQTGKLRWQRAIDAFAQRFGAPSGTLLFSVNRSAEIEVSSIDLTTGRTRWSRRFAGAELKPTSDACCRGLLQLGGELIEQEGSMPARFRLLDAATGKDRWQTTLPRLVNTEHSFADGRKWILVEGDRTGCNDDQPCAERRVYRVVDAGTGQRLADIELRVRSPSFADRAPALGSFADVVYFEEPTTDAKAGYRTHIVAYDLLGAKRAWQTASAQCARYEEPKVLADARYVYACECDSVLRVYTHKGALAGSWGVQHCAGVELDAGGMKADEQPVGPAEWSAPPHPLRVSGVVNFGHPSDEEAFSGWVLVGQKLVRPDRAGRFSAHVLARGWTLVEPLPKLELLPQADDRHVPPATTTIDVGSVSVGYWQ